MKKIILGSRYLYTGAGCIKTAVNDIRAERVAIITGSCSMIKAGITGNIMNQLRDHNIVSRVFSGIPSNPAATHVDELARSLRAFHPDSIIAVGGGSAIDTAKIALLFYDFPELTWESALGGHWPEAPRKTGLIAIPSTSGTGTEVTRVSVVTFPEQQLKIGLRTDALMPDIAVLDPEITLTMPDNIVAETGMDALTHALECFTNKNLDGFSSIIALGAIRELLEWLPRSYQDRNLTARAKVHYAQSAAGIVFPNTGLGMCHGISHAFGGFYNLGHGLLNAIILPYVIEYNCRDSYVRQQVLEIENSCNTDNLVETLFALNKSLNIPLNLQTAGIDEQSFSASFATLLTNSLKGSTLVNPVAMNETDMTGFLKTIYYGK